jgi:hypothetical protein
MLSAKCAEFNLSLKQKCQAVKPDTFDIIVFYELKSFLNQHTHWFFQ